MKTLVVLLSLLFNQFTSNKHDFHISVCDISYNERSEKYEIGQRIFQDDLEQDLERLQYPELSILIKAGNTTLIDSILSSYVKEKLHISVNTQPLPLIYIGSVVKKDALVVYFEFSCPNEASSFKIKNTLLIDLFDDQVNLIHWKKGDFKNSIKLSKDKTLGTISLE